MRILKRALLALAALVVVLVVVALGVIRYVGAWNLVFPNRTHEVEPPALPDARALPHPAVLVFTKTNGFRHVEGIAAGRALLEDVAARRGWHLFPTENGAVMRPDLLARFDAVVFLNASGDMFDEAQERAFQEWLESGGGWLGVHAAGDGSHAEWRWYVDTLIGAGFIGHPMGPQFQTARVRVEDATHPATAALPATFDHEEEWYSWDRSPRLAGMHVLATIDERTYSPIARIFGSERDLRMGSDHPVAWTRCVGRGRAVYSALGHAAAAYDVPENRALLEGALAWALGAEGEGCGEDR